MENYKRTSKYLSLILRHKPSEVNLKLDEFGYVNVDKLIEGMNKKGCVINRGILDEIVKSDNKQRYSYSKDKEMIRANQGHTIKVNTTKEAKPPEVLFHGTSKSNFNKLVSSGYIKKMKRLHVHLSKDVKTAINVGSRHGDVIVLKIDSVKMFNDGYKFEISDNGVWLTNIVPMEYVTINE